MEGVIKGLVGIISNHSNRIKKVEDMFIGIISKNTTNFTLIFNSLTQLNEKISLIDKRITLLESKIITNNTSMPKTSYNSR